MPLRVSLYHLVKLSTIMNSITFKFKIARNILQISTPAMASLVDLGKRLLEASKKGQADEVSMLMTSGAPFTTDWVGM